MKKITAILFALFMGIAVTSCKDNMVSQSQEEISQEISVEAPLVEESTANTENSSAEPVVLVVSFGTSYNETRKATIEAIENEIAEKYPQYQVRRAFTSQMIINKLKDRDNLVIDNVQEAMERLVKDGVKKVIIQPTHVMSGFEYDDMAEEVKPYEDKFESFKIGSPLLSTDEDYSKAADIITEETKEYAKGNTAVVFMGHGTEHEANSTYSKLQQVLSDKGYSNYIIGTVEAEPTLEDTIAQVNKGKYEKVVLLPFMIVAGDHANNDMAGDNEDSWKTTFKKEGYEVECVLKGLGEYEGIRTMFAEKISSLMGD